MTPFQYHEHLDGRLIGSEAPRLRTEVAGIVWRCGITALVTLTESFREFGLPDVRQHHIPMRGCPSLEDVVQIVGIVTDALDRGGASWIHCQCGVDRTGAMIAAVLVRSGMEVEEALSEVEATFPAHRQHPEYARLWQPYGEVVMEYARMLAPRPR